MLVSFGMRLETNFAASMKISLLFVVLGLLSYATVVHAQTISARFGLSAGPGKDGLARQQRTKGAGLSGALAYDQAFGDSKKLRVLSNMSFSKVVSTVTNATELSRNDVSNTENVGYGLSYNDINWYVGGIDAQALYTVLGSPAEEDGFGLALGAGLGYSFLSSEALHPVSNSRYYLTRSIKMVQRVAELRYQRDMNSLSLLAWISPLSAQKIEEEPAGTTRNKQIAFLGGGQLLGDARLTYLHEMNGRWHFGGYAGASSIWQGEEIGGLYTLNLGFSLRYNFAGLGRAAYRNKLAERRAKRNVEKANKSTYDTEPETEEPSN